jgi:hypothetical protein
LANERLKSRLAAAAAKRLSRRFSPDPICQHDLGGRADLNSVPSIDRRFQGWNTFRHILIKQPEASIFAVSSPSGTQLNDLRIEHVL